MYFLLSWVDMSYSTFLYDKRKGVFFDKGSQTFFHSISWDQACIKLYDIHGASFFIYFEAESGENISCILNSLSVTKEECPESKGLSKNFSRYRIFTSVPIVSQLFQIQMPYSRQKMSDIIQSIYVDLFEIRKSVNCPCLHIFMHPRITLITNYGAQFCKNLIQYKAVTKDASL